VSCINYEVPCHVVSSIALIIHLLYVHIFSLKYFKIPSVFCSYYSFLTKIAPNTEHSSKAIDILYLWSLLVLLLPSRCERQELFLQRTWNTKSSLRTFEKDNTINCRGSIPDLVAKYWFGESQPGPVKNWFEMGMILQEICLKSYKKLLVRC